MRAGSNGGVATLEGIGTAVPGHQVSQEEIRRRAESFYGALPGVERYLSVYDNAGVRTRYFAMPTGWYEKPQGWAERNRIFVEAATNLLEEAARKALDRAQVSPKDVRSLVVVSTTGLATPSLDARLAERLGLGAGIQRIPVWGLGCAGGVSGLGLGSDLARTRESGVSLVAAVELCSLNFDPGDRSVRQLVATSLFGDGAAAAILAPPGTGTGPGVRARHSHLFPRSFDVMGWDVEDAGLRVVLSPRLPQVVREGLAAAASPILAQADPAKIQHAPHPGGPKVLDAYADALRLDAHALDASREVLAAYGNMSSPTAYFVLDQVLARGPPPKNPILMGAFGPGFSAEFVLLDAAATS